MLADSHFTAFLELKLYGRLSKTGMESWAILLNDGGCRQCWLLTSEPHSSPFQSVPALSKLAQVRFGLKPQSAERGKRGERRGEAKVAKTTGRLIKTFAQPC